MTSKGIHFKLSEEAKEKIRLSKLGNKNPMFGKHPKLSEEHKKKISLNNCRYWKGKHRSEEWKKKMSLIHKSMPNSGWFKKGYKSISYWKGKYLSEEHKKKLKKAALSGKKSNFWKGGISFEPYGKEFNKQLKEQIRQKDNHRCQECFREQNELRDKNNKHYRLIVHHIDFNKKNNNISNLISLCRSCHAQTNFNRNDWTNHFQNIMQKN